MFEIQYYIKNIKGLSSTIITIVVSLTIVSILTLLFLLIVNRTGRFAGYLLNKKHKDMLDQLYNQYAMVLSNDNFCEDYEINKRHRQRSDIEDEHKLSDIELSKWINDFIYLALEEEKITNIFKKYLTILVIVIFLSITPFITRLFIFDIFDVSTRFIILLTLTLFYKFLIDGVRSFRVSGYRLSLINYKKMITKSKFRDLYEQKIAVEVGNGYT